MWDETSTSPNLKAMTHLLSKWYNHESSSGAVTYTERKMKAVLSSMAYGREHGLREAVIRWRYKMQVQSFICYHLCISYLSASHVRPSLDFHEYF